MSCNWFLHVLLTLCKHQVYKIYSWHIDIELLLLQFIKMIVVSYQECCSAQFELYSFNKQGRTPVGWLHQSLATCPTLLKWLNLVSLYFAVLNFKMLAFPDWERSYVFKTSLPNECHHQIKAWLTRAITLRSQLSWGGQAKLEEIMFLIKENHFKDVITFCFCAELLITSCFFLYRWVF